jgi:co-chaperonin GroES (HSP10)
MICEVCKREKPEKAVVVTHQTPFTCPECGVIDFPYQPLRDIVFLYADPLPERLGSFYLPAQYRENHGNEFGIVLAHGRGYYDKKGTFHPTSVRPGDRVMYDKNIPWWKMVFAPDGKEYKIKYMPECDIKGVVEE